MAIPWPPERRAAARANVARLAEQVGLEFGERTHWYDSTLAHEAAEWAREQDAPALEEEFRRAVFRAYFAQVRNIADPDVLLDTAASVAVSGANGTQTRYTPAQLADLRAALAERRYREAVQRQFQEAREIGVTGVPTTIAGNYALVGAHPYEQFRRLMAAAGAEERPEQPTD
jgi:predicted DsbA family dithiol-disulfide isomerase